MQIPIGPLGDSMEFEVFFHGKMTVNSTDIDEATDIAYARLQLIHGMEFEIDSIERC